MTAISVLPNSRNFCVTETKHGRRMWCARKVWEALQERGNYQSYVWNAKVDPQPVCLPQRHEGGPDKKGERFSKFMAFYQACSGITGHSSQSIAGVHGTACSYQACSGT